MKTKTKEVYYCEHCKKHGLSKYAMGKHEKACRSNPDNYRDCFGCKCCVERTLEVFIEWSSAEIHDTELKTVLFCTKRDTGLIPPKAEHKGNAHKLVEFENIPMFKAGCCEMREDICIYIRDLGGMDVDISVDMDKLFPRN